MNYIRIDVLTGEYTTHNDNVTQVNPDVYSVIRAPDVFQKQSLEDGWYECVIARDSNKFIIEYKTPDGEITCEPCDGLMCHYFPNVRKLTLNRLKPEPRTPAWYLSHQRK